MSTAELIDDLPAHRPAVTGRAKGKPPLALRPLHRMWRKTIDEIQVSALDLPVRGLPAALQGLVACQISDFHVRSRRGSRALGLSGRSDQSATA